MRDEFDSPNIRSLIPARIDRLPWSPFFTKLVIALGIAWILDGLEITIAANVGPDLTLHNTLNLGAGSVADIAWWYLIGEVIGALFFGRLSDKLGRKNLFVITLGVYLIGSGLTAATPGNGSWIITYLLSGILLLIVSFLFKNGSLDATTQTLCWAVIFFFASAGASAGYLTASEVFPLEVRAKAIAVFFAIAQCFGAFGSAWYGHLIGTGQDRNTLFVGYVVGAVAMILGGLTAVFFAVDAEGKSLEDVATPLSVIAKPSQAIFRSGGDRGSAEGQPAS